MKKFLNEFKTFALRGNVIDLAVGNIIGGAFQAIVSSLVDDVIMPVISLATKGVNFSDWFIALDGKTYPTLEIAKASGAATLSYGNFISAVLNFVIMAFVIFVMIKLINKLTEKSKKKTDTDEKAPTTKVCPFCKSEIDVNATRCAHCTSELSE